MNTRWRRGGYRHCTAGFLRLRICRAASRRPRLVLCWRGGNLNDHVLEHGLLLSGMPGHLHRRNALGSREAVVRVEVVCMRRCAVAFPGVETPEVGMCIVVHAALLPTPRGLSHAGVAHFRNLRIE